MSKRKYKHSSQGVYTAESLLVYLTHAGAIQTLDEVDVPCATYIVYVVSEKKRERRLLGALKLNISGWDISNFFEVWLIHSYYSHPWCQASKYVMCNVSQPSPNASGVAVVMQECDFWGTSLHTDADRNSSPITDTS